MSGHQGFSPAEEEAVLAYVARLQNNESSALHPPFTS